MSFLLFLQNQTPNLTIMDEKLEFLKGIFNLKNKEVDWGVVQETTYEDNEKVVEHKPGLYIKDSHVFVDLYARRFYSIIKLPEIKREILPAKLLIITEETMFANDDTDDTDDIPSEKKAVLIAKDNDSIKIVLPEDFIEYLFEDTIYNPGMEESLLL